LLFGRLALGETAVASTHDLTASFGWRDADAVSYWRRDAKRDGKEGGMEEEVGMEEWCRVQGREGRCGRQEGRAEGVAKEG
jgi:hypothetical protein